MKKSAIRKAELLLALTTLLLPCLSCKGKNQAATGTTSGFSSKSKSSLVKTVSLNQATGTASFDSMVSFFKPDYTPEVPDDLTTETEQTATSKKSQKEKGFV